MTPAGIEPATFRFVAQHLNHCATAVPSSLKNEVKYNKKRIFYTAIHVDVRCFYLPVVIFWHLNLEPRCCYRLWDICVCWEKFWYHVPFHETRSFVIVFARAHQCALLWAVGFHEDNFIPFRGGKKKMQTAKMRYFSDSMFTCCFMKMYDVHWLINYWWRQVRTL